MMCKSKVSSDRLFLMFFIFLITKSISGFCQEVNDNINVSYGINTWDPVHIKADEKKGRTDELKPINFTAINSTYYPFELAITFSVFENLTPRPSVRPITLSHGLNNLYTLSVQVPGVGYGYRYTYLYWLKPSDKIIDEKFPYLIPLKEGKTVISKNNLTGKILNSFAGKQGDTIYSMRRGLVTAVPHSETMYFRISNDDCLEVLQPDGTYMIYHNLSKNDMFTAPGKSVLPGEPIGVMSDSAYIYVSLLKVSETKNILENQPITYSTGREETASYDEFKGVNKSVHPIEIITREMNHREMKKILTNNHLP